MPGFMRKVKRFGERAEIGITLKLRTLVSKKGVAVIDIALRIYTSL